ncbi:MAG: aminoacyl-tRNA hydrolase [bacterium]
MWLVVGLGNPGQRYHLTRHNIGFSVIDLLAKQYRIRLTQHKYHAIIGSGQIGEAEVVIAKPLTYMNRSGTAVREILSGLKLQVSELVVISDDFHLPVGTIRVRRQGSSGGHHGLESIIEQLSTSAFNRLRIGIGEPEEEDVTDYVLGNFAREELAVVEESIEKASFAVTEIVEHGITEAMNKYNKKISQTNTGMIE